MRVYFLFTLVFVSLSFALDNGEGLFPPMGWNTWCSLCQCGRDYCDASEVLNVAQTMVKNGMQKLGYNYINLDDCWADTRTPGTNVITADKNRFPNGMKDLVDKIHALGYKFGLYTCAGTQTCSSGLRNHTIPGSYGFYDLDAATYASWGVDFVKMDWCYTQGLDPRVQYPQFSKSLNKTGRPIFFELCEWGLDKPWTWAQPVGNQWRTTGDHHDTWSSTLQIINDQAGLSKYSGKGAWNYMDFLYTGGQGCKDPNVPHCPGQSPTEYRTEFSFWSFLNSGLIVATDVRVMSPIMREVLYNEEIIALNKDPLRKQGDRVAQYSPPDHADKTLQVWARPLSDGSEAIILFNTDSKAYSIQALYKYWGWSQGTVAVVRDLWAHQTIGAFTDSYSAVVDPHGVRVFKLRKA